MGEVDGVCILARHTVKPSPRFDGQERIDLTPWDLKLLSVDYIQKGILFHKPQRQAMDEVVDRLRASFARALDQFYPLAGRLRTTVHSEDGAKSTISISLDCTDDGAEFIHASAPGIVVSDIVAPVDYYIPPVVRSFFPIDCLVNHDGHSHPLLGAQVTELADGVFIACTFNHTVADGTSFWHFFSVWSAISRTGLDTVVDSPVFDRWFTDSCPVPLRLPFTDHSQFVRRVQPPPLRECAFHFSASNIKKLKARANEEMGVDNISSLQALLAHAWRSVTRARGLAPNQQTTYIILAGYRSRMNPPLPKTYLGNSILGVPVTALAGDVLQQGLGWTAWQLNQVVASLGLATGVDWVKTWVEKPTFLYLDLLKETDMITGSSPRFDVYGNDFGWGRPVAVRSGRGSKVHGKTTVYPGTEEGSMALEICITAEAMSALLQDREFMAVVG